MLAESFSPTFDCQHLVEIFNQTFASAYHTELVAGGHEPLYSPQHGQYKARIVFAHDYFSSALHEISHWLIAGEERRKMEDYGYWYSPDGRDTKQQAAFEKVEVAPQALEWILNKACGKSFRLSLDNLSGDTGDSRAFAEAVWHKTRDLATRGLSVRASQMRQALIQFYGTHSALTPADFRFEEIYRP